MRLAIRVGPNGKIGQRLGRWSVWASSENRIYKASRRIVLARFPRAIYFRRQDDDGSEGCSSARSRTDQGGVFGVRVMRLAPTP